MKPTVPPSDSLRALRALLAETGPSSRRQVLGWLGVAGGRALLGGGLGAGLLGCAESAPETAEESTEPEAPAGLGPDGVLPAPGLPEPRFVDTNGIRLGVYDTGGDGPPVVFCHGFPELAFSWRHQIGAVPASGYRAIAPDQRGYGISDKPEGMDQYTVKHLVDDMAGMLDALEIDRAIFCGHDWGGGVVWMMPRVHPDRVLGVIGLNTPTGHPGKPREPTEPSLIVRTENYYTNTFQEPGRAEAVLEEDVRKTFEYFMRRGGIWSVEAFSALPEDSPERQMDLLRMLQESDPGGEVFLTEDELAYFVDTFEKTGFTGGLNWYRASAQVEIDWGQELAWNIEVPCLYVGAENDVILRPSSADGMGEFIADFERTTVEDCGHWTQQEKPDELNGIVLDWLGRKFPAAPATDDVA